MKKKNIHPLWLRLCHWTNAMAVLIMVASGLRIYNASPLFDFQFPKDITLGGWLGGALQWHFAGMWLFVINGITYLILCIFSGRFKHKYWPLSLREFFSEVKASLKGELSHANINHYNMVQKFAYLFVLADSVLLVISGLTVWKSVQFQTLGSLLGGYDTARIIHFWAMIAMVSFIIIHFMMVVFFPRTLLAMLRGR